MSFYTPADHEVDVAANSENPGAHVLQTTKACQVHNKHLPFPHVNHLHHVWPLGDGGPDSDDNKIVACPTGHYNIHTLIRLYKLHGGRPPYALLRPYSYGERKYAKLGYDRIVQQRM